MRIDIEDGLSVGLGITVNVDIAPSQPSDADLLDLANVILASDLVQNMSWTGTPALDSVTVPDVRILFP